MGRAILLIVAIFLFTSCNLNFNIKDRGFYVDGYLIYTSNLLLYKKGKKYVGVPCFPSHAKCIYFVPDEYVYFCAKNYRIKEDAKVFMLYYGYEDYKMREIFMNCADFFYIDEETLEVDEKVDNYGRYKQYQNYTQILRCRVKLKRYETKEVVEERRNERKRYPIRNAFVSFDNVDTFLVDDLHSLDLLGIKKVIGKNCCKKGKVFKPKDYGY